MVPRLLKANRSRLAAKRRNGKTGPQNKHVEYRELSLAVVGIQCPVADSSNRRFANGLLFRI
jgi:hypothetical protein